MAFEGFRGNTSGSYTVCTAAKKLKLFAFASKEMESPNKDGEIISNLLFPDVSCNFSLDPLIFKVDICNLLLNAMDEQLEKLQIQHPKKDAVSSKQDWNNQVNLEGGKSLSIDKNLGHPAFNETPMSCFDLMHSSVMKKKSGKIYPS
ncbi:hypothetical protein OJAV_G00089320 [Oryzias javanicus]|uniref:Uncharacterized protein n=1 Tax=Oryzias javanicus TaxID=123683 RepID=A0A437D0G2_ORYJA|nr:hypothetical protein OJAV_G00089320 [Oryzias javanicus]